MTKMLSLVLLLAGLGLGFYGYKKYTENSESREILGIQFSVENKEGRNNAYIFMGVGALLAVGGLMGLTKK